MTPTFRELRDQGANTILIYCRDHRCSHHVETNADGWADDLRLSDIEPPPPAVTDGGEMGEASCAGDGDGLGGAIRAIL